MPTPRKLDTAKAIKLRAQGLSYAEIGKATGCHPTTVHTALVNIGAMILPPDQLEQYRAKQADVLDTIAARTLASISDEDYKKASLLQKATATAVLIDKSRLIKGQTTENIGIMGYFKAVTTSHDEEIQQIGSPALLDENDEYIQQVEPEQPELTTGLTPVKAARKQKR